MERFASRSSAVSLPLGFVVLVVITLLAPRAEAKSPRIAFDVHQIVGCNDVTPPEFAEHHPDERLVEARFPVSSLIEQGDEDDLIEYFYRFESPRRTARIVDYLPKTSMASELAGNVGVEKKKERTKSLGVVATGSLAEAINVTGNGSIGSKDTSSVRYELLPPMELVAASGTLNRGAAAFFKLKPTAQSTLEGGREFVLVLRVPADWRADVMYVRTQASGWKRGVVPPLNERHRSGQQQFIVALHLEGDERAKRLATNLGIDELRLRRAARRNREQIEELAYPSVAHKFGALLSIVDAKIPAYWLQRVLYEPTTRTPASLNRLPNEVRVAVANYVDTKQRLYQLAGKVEQRTDVGRR